MNILSNGLTKSIAAVLLVFSLPVMAQEAPDVLVKRVSEEVLDAAKSDRQVQGGNRREIYELVQERILPHIDFERMTALAAGRFWREATPEQKKELTAQFRDLLVRTYSGVLSQVRDQKLVFKPMRGTPSDNQVEVRSQVIQPGGEPIQLNYRMHKTAAGWKIYDINVLGAWLVETYKGTFASEINKSGIDGLIKTLTEKNKRLASASSRA